MAKYVLYMDQGEGCDYTIACGKILIPLKSENLEDVRNEVKEKVKYYGCYPDDERQLKTLKVLEITNSYDFLDDIYTELRDEKRKRKEEELRKKELALLEKLKKKYE